LVSQRRGGGDPGGAVAIEREQVRLVARHQPVGDAGLAEREQEIIAGVDRKKRNPVSPQRKYPR
jgi:hypothetical protein